MSTQTDKERGTVLDRDGHEVCVVFDVKAGTVLEAGHRVMNLLDLTKEHATADVRGWWLPEEPLRSEIDHNDRMPMVLIPDLSVAADDTEEYVRIREAIARYPQIFVEAIGFNAPMLTAEDFGVLLDIAAKLPVDELGDISAGEGQYRWTERQRQVIDLAHGAVRTRTA